RVIATTSERLSPFTSAMSHASVGLQKPRSQRVAAWNAEPVDLPTHTPAVASWVNATRSARPSASMSDTLQTSPSRQKKTSHFCGEPRALPLESPTQASWVEPRVKAIASAFPSLLTSPTSHVSFALHKKLLHFCGVPNEDPFDIPAHTWGLALWVNATRS